MQELLACLLCTAHGIGACLVGSETSIRYSNYVAYIKAAGIGKSASLNCTRERLAAADKHVLDVLHQKPKETALSLALYWFRRSLRRLEIGVKIIQGRR
jgi:hypothetical protein